MDLYTEYSNLSDEELNQKIQKLTKMYNFYQLTDNGHMKNSIEFYLNTCYNIQDERADMRYYEQLNRKEDGVVVDTQILPEVETKNEQDTTKRRRRTRSTI